MPEPYRASTPLATGTMTFLFADIEGSTRLWEEAPERMRPAQALHDAIARDGVRRHRGDVVKTTGDGMLAVFGDPLDAIAATLDLQQALADPEATAGVTLRVRCGLHAGVDERRDNDFFGRAVNRAARIMSAAHGGQVLVSEAVAALVRDRLPEGVALRDLGQVRLRDLARPEQIFQVLHPALRESFPALRALEATPNNLPQQATRFIWREKELAELNRLLASSRLLTLTGTGGCGKTRLSLQAAAESLERYPDGAWLVELAPLSDPGLLPQTVATVLCLKEEPAKPVRQTLVEYLKDKRLLLLLDNCEHLLDGCAKLADTLLRQCPRVTILASSREALGIDGEQAYRVPSLSLPDPKQAHTPASVAPFEAVQLFTDRALLARSDFQVTHQNAATLVSICHRLDGIPLAIELAAARVRSLSIEEIDRKLDQRFSILTGGSRTALPRQQTLRSLIDWSYDLLNDRERELLRGLAVFAGGWTLEAAEEVCAGDGVQDPDVLDLLTSLCDKSLVMVEQDNGSTRYRLLETVRQYARERLLESGSGAALRQTHRDYYLALAEEADPKLVGTEQAAWLRRFEEEHDNLRSALEWSHAARESVESLRFCGALQRFWRMRGHLSEGRQWCARALGHAGGEELTPVRAKALSAAGLLAYWLGDYPAARALHEECLATWRQLGDQWGMAGSLNNLGMVARSQGDNASARTLYEDSLAIKRELGDQWGVGASLNNLGNLAADQGDFPASRPLHEESLAIWRKLGDRGGIATALENLGHVAYEQGDLASARALQVESLTMRRQLGDKLGMVVSLEMLAAVAGLLGAPLRAARIWGVTERLRAQIGSPLQPKDRSRHDQHVAAARAASSDNAAFDRAWQEGGALTIEQAIELALEETVERPLL
jgi:predicted ATPase/class 3 adenylate cyclase